MLYRVVLTLLGLYTPTVFAAGCEAFVAHLNQCQPYVCEERSPLDRSERIERQVLGSQGNACRYREVLYLEETVEIDCAYTDAARQEKAEGLITLRKGLFAGRALLDTMFVDEQADHCEVSVTPVTLENYLIPERGHTQWF